MARKQGNICQNMQKQGSFGVFLFRVQLNFFPVFQQGELFPPPGALLAKIFTLQKEFSPKVFLLFLLDISLFHFGDS